MKVHSVQFASLIPLTANERQPSFHASDGWTITEESPGRVRLRRGKIDRIVQGHAYALSRTEEPVPEPVPSVPPPPPSSRPKPPKPPKPEPMPPVPFEPSSSAAPPPTPTPKPPVKAKPKRRG